MRRAAYFLLESSYHGRPLDRGIVQALLDADYDVDLFYPAPVGSPEPYPAARVACRLVSFRSRWLLRQLFSPAWRRYDLFLGTPDLAVAVAGVLAGAAGRPLVTVCDEIYAGGYAGQAAGHWKKAATLAMRRSRFTIITDHCRQSLQCQAAGLKPSHLFYEYPCCYAFPFAPRRPRQEIRDALGIGEQDFVVVASGRFSADTGAAWVIRLLDCLPPGVRLMIQPGGVPEPVADSLLSALSARDRRLVYLPGRVGFLESLEVANAADAALVLYLSGKPQFQLMGVSSNKVCTALWMGKPVIVSAQPSFHFVEEYGCGVPVDAEDGLPRAIEKLRAGYDVYSRNAVKCLEGHIRPRERLRELTDVFRVLK